MAQEHVPVVIVGAGGTGLSLSLLLQQQGVPSLVVERRAEISWFPRARNLNFRTLEIFRGLGLSAAVHAAGSKMSSVYRKQTLASTEQEELLDPTTLVEHVEEISPEPFGLYCPQSHLEPLLLAEARRHGVDVRYNTELVSFTQDKLGVTATIKEHTTSTLRDVRADYLVAADGAHSRIREALHMPVTGMGALPEYYTFVYFRANWGELIRNYVSDAVMIVNDAVRGMFLTADQDRGMFMIITPESTEAYSAEHYKSLILAAIGRPDIVVEIVDVGPWQPIQRVADRFQEGRVFLVGDAAHTMPPKLGLGLNTAIQSAHNLAWKLAAVLKREASPRLLATYQIERHPVGWLAAEQSLNGPAATVFTREAGADAQHYQVEKQAPILAPIVGYQYHSAAMLTDTAAEDGIGLLPRVELTGQPGTRMPHLWVERQGQRLSTLDLLDGRWLLLAGSDGASWCQAARMAATNRGIDIAAYQIAVEGDLHDAEDGWRTKVNISPEAALLVRPDGFVAWRSMTLPSDPAAQLEQVLAHILG